MKCFLPLVAVLPLLLTGCSHQPYYAPPPPPPAAYTSEVPPLVQLADQNGYRAGLADGGRDAYNRAGYAPRHDRNFRRPPGYDPRLGPFPPYVDEFRRAYLRGYDQGFNRR